MARTALLIAVLLLPLAACGIDGDPVPPDGNSWSSRGTGMDHSDGALDRLEQQDSTVFDKEL